MQPGRRYIGTRVVSYLILSVFELRLNSLNSENYAVGMLYVGRLYNGTHDGLHSLSDINSLLQQGSPLWNTFGGRADHEGSRVSSTRYQDDETEGDGD